MSAPDLDGSTRIVLVTGASRGIGRAAAIAFARSGAHVVALARTRGLRRIWVETDADWTSAVRLYERCGFRQFARTDDSVFLERLPGSDEGGAA